MSADVLGERTDAECLGRRRRRLRTHSFSTVAESQSESCFDEVDLKARGLLVLKSRTGFGHGNQTRRHHDSSAACIHSWGVLEKDTAMLWVKVQVHQPVESYSKNMALLDRNTQSC